MKELPSIRVHRGVMQMTEMRSELSGTVLNHRQLIEQGRCSALSIRQKRAQSSVGRSSVFSGGAEFYLEFPDLKMLTSN